MNPTHIIIHHSLTKDSQTVSWQAIRRYHIHTLGWRNIGYHYGIENVNGEYEILKGRMDNWTGAHCHGFNDNSIGICLVGNFDITEPSDQQMLTLRYLCQALLDIHGIKAENVLGHWETYRRRNLAVQKSCPGNRFRMSMLRAAI